MPYPRQIQRDTLIATACELIEAHGVEAISLRRVAEKLGIKAPSLYHHVNDKTELLRGVNELTINRLMATLYAAMQTDGDARTRFRAVAAAYRTFAHAHPVTYELAYTTRLNEMRPDAAELEAAVLPLQALMAQMTGEADALPALRGALALIHGWVMLELNHQYRRGGDLNAHFQQAVSAYLAGWAG